MFGDPFPPGGLGQLGPRGPRGLRAPSGPGRSGGSRCGLFCSLGPRVSGNGSGGATGSGGHFLQRPGLLGFSEVGPSGPTHNHTHRPISRRSSGSSRLSRSRRNSGRRNSGRRHPRPRSRPTPRTPPPTTWRPEIASARPAPGAGRWRHGSGRKATPRNTRERRGLPPGAHPSAPSGGKTNSFHWGWFT